MKTRGKQFKKRSTGQRGPEVGNAHVCSVVSDSFATAWTAAHQAPLSMGFSRQEYWSGLPFLSPGDLPDQEIEAEYIVSPALWGNSL